MSNKVGLWGVVGRRDKKLIYSTLSFDPYITGGVLFDKDFEDEEVRSNYRVVRVDVTIDEIHTSDKIKVEIESGG